MALKAMFSVQPSRVHMVIRFAEPSQLRCLEEWCKQEKVFCCRAGSETWLFDPEDIEKIKKWLVAQGVQELV